MSYYDVNKNLQTHVEVILACLHIKLQPLAKGVFNGLRGSSCKECGEIVVMVVWLTVEVAMWWNVVNYTFYYYFINWFTYVFARSACKINQICNIYIYIHMNNTHIKNYRCRGCCSIRAETSAAMKEVVSRQRVVENVWVGFSTPFRTYILYIYLIRP